MRDFKRRSNRERGLERQLWCVRCGWPVKHVAHDFTRSTTGCANTVVSPMCMHRFCRRAYRSGCRVDSILVVVCVRLTRSVSHQTSVDIDVTNTSPDSTWHSIRPLDTRGNVIFYSSEDAFLASLCSLVHGDIGQRVGSNARGSNNKSFQTQGQCSLGTPRSLGCNVGILTSAFLWGDPRSPRYQTQSLQDVFFFFITRKDFGLCGTILLENVCIIWRNSWVVVDSYCGLDCSWSGLGEVVVMVPRLRGTSWYSFRSSA